MNLNIISPVTPKHSIINEPIENPEFKNENLIDKIAEQTLKEEESSSPPSLTHKTVCTGKPNDNVISLFQNFYNNESCKKITLPDGSTYIGNTLNGKKHGLGKFIDIPKNTIYIGQFHDDHKHGQGSQSFLVNGGLYIGEFLDGDVGSEGCLYLRDDNRYFGDIKKGEMEGEGCLYFANGDIYIGEFRNGMMHGYGSIQNAEGRLIYKGEFERNKKSGPGIFYFSDGGSYCGNFLKDKFNGFGKFMRPDGITKYVGYLKNNLKHGHGTHFFDDGSIYTGDFHENKLHGRGVSISTNDFCLIGEFKRGMMNGTYTNITPDGERMTCRYENDQLCAAEACEIGNEERINFDDGSFYIGETLNGTMHGYGRLINRAHGMIHEGYYENGLRNGHGTLYFREGGYYIGGFQDGRMHGNGQITIETEYCIIKVWHDMGRFVNIVENSYFDELEDIKYSEPETCKTKGESPLPNSSDSADDPDFYVGD